MTFDDGRDRDRDTEPGRSGILPESLRKALATGLSAVFMTEEGIRNLLSDVRMPKDAVAYLLQQTDKSRRELFRIVSDELKSFLKNADLPGEIRRALIGLRMEVKAQVRFVDDQRSESTFSASMASADSEDDETPSSSTPDASSGGAHRGPSSRGDRRRAHSGHGEPEEH